MTEIAPQLTSNERDFDRLFMEELAFGEGFLEAFCAKIGVQPKPVASIRHSVTENFGGLAWGETDIFVAFEDDTALLIENKLSAGFQPEQAERYRARAAHHAGRGLRCRTVLIAPKVYLSSVDTEDWDHVCSYEDIADCMGASDPRSRWRQALFREAGSRAARVSRLAASSAARKAASAELLAFKTSWLGWIRASGDWAANPQRGATDEFLYRPRDNPFGLRIWHHPLAGYLSVQNLGKFAHLWDADFRRSLPEGFRLSEHPSDIYLDATVPAIDMSSDFAVEKDNVIAGMEIARKALDLAEAAIRDHMRSS